VEVGVVWLMPDAAVGLVILHSDFVLDLLVQLHHLLLVVLVVSH